jgi:hypothetical protein
MKVCTLSYWVCSPPGDVSISLSDMVGVFCVCESEKVWICECVGLGYICCFIWVQECIGFAMDCCWCYVLKLKVEVRSEGNG